MWVLVSIVCPQTLEQGGEDSLLQAPLGLGSRKRELEAELSKDWALSLHSTSLPTWAPDQTFCSLAYFRNSPTWPQWPTLGYFYLEVMLAWGIRDLGTQRQCVPRMDGERGREDRVLD